MIDTTRMLFHEPTDRQIRSPSWRPRNETEDDRRAERAAADILQVAWQCDIRKLSERLYEIDWVFSRGTKPLAWGEFKRRNRRYDTIILSYAKFERGMTLANNSKLPFMFVIEIDGTLYWNQLKSCYEVQIAGNHRGQNGDIEPCVFIPFSEFKPV